MATKKNQKRLAIAAIAALLTIAGVVFATTGGGIISFWVDGRGKTDEQVADEIREQLLEGGMADPEVEVKRNDNTTKVEIEGTQGERHIKLIRKEKGGDSSVIQMHHEPLDTEREPNMTDAKLEDKIRAQLRDRGLEGEVHVNGDEIRVKVEKRIDETTDDETTDNDAVGDEVTDEGPGQAGD